MDLALRLAVFEPIKMVGQRMSLKSIDRDVDKARFQQKFFEAFSRVKNQMLAPKCKFLERVESQKVDQEIPRMRDFENHDAARFHFFSQSFGRLNGVRQMFENMKERDDVE